MSLRPFSLTDRRNHDRKKGIHGPALAGPAPSFGDLFCEFSSACWICRFLKHHIRENHNLLIFHSSQMLFSHPACWNIIGNHRPKLKINYFHKFISAILFSELIHSQSVDILFFWNWGSEPYGCHCTLPRIGMPRNLYGYWKLWKNGTSEISLARRLHRLVV